MSDTWLTPPELVERLGVFNLDPCAAPSPRPWSTAEAHWEWPYVDGLTVPWPENYRVWLNPPYGKCLGLWLGKMAEYCRPVKEGGVGGSGIALVFARTETEAWQKWVWPHADSVLFVDGRLHFHLPDGSRAKGSAGSPSALIAYTEVDTEILKKSGIKGALVRVVARQ